MPWNSPPACSKQRILFLWFPFSPLFFQANKGIGRIKAPDITFQSDYIGPFTYRNFPRPKLKKRTVLSMKTFLLQTSPLHRTTIPVSPQVLTWTQVPTDTPKSVPFFLHKDGGKPHLAIFPLDHLCFWFCSQSLFKAVWRSFAETKSLGTTQSTQKWALPMQPLEGRGKLNPPPRRI